MKGRGRGDGSVRGPWAGRLAGLAGPLAAVLAAAALLAAPAAGLQLPGEALPRQTLRPYAYVFVAYALAWLLVLGWTVAIARRLARLERRFRDGG